MGAANLGPNNVFTFPITPGNKNVQIEVSKETELGFDMGLKLLSGKWLKNGSISITQWDRKSDNVLYNVDVAPSLGYGSAPQNAYGLGSNGIQASLNLNVLTSKKFAWDFTTNFSKQTSKITKVTGAEVVTRTSAIA